MDVCSGLSLPSDSDFWGDGYFDDDDDDDNTTQHNTTQHNTQLTNRYGDLRESVVDSLVHI